MLYESPGLVDLWHLQWAYNVGLENSPAMFVANIEDEFDIVITMNQQAEIETVGQLVDAVGQLQG